MAWIIQFRENSLDNCVEIADLLFNPHFLFDSSGGRGELPDSWPTIDLPNMGAAGGLNPENIRANLDLMRERGYIRDGFWIDVESGVRTDDRWDWDKARAFIENTEDAQSIMEVVPRSASI
jgi:phosphoribosylanthranilate isomerase